MKWVTVTLALIACLAIAHGDASANSRVVDLSALGMLCKCLRVII